MMNRNVEQNIGLRPLLLVEGGAVNDFLDGGEGNDAYLFGRGSGQDTLLSQDNTINKRISGSAPLRPVQDKGDFL